MTAVRPDLVFIHPSDELYGADRMLLQLLASVGEGHSVEVWLPTDLPHVADALSTAGFSDTQVGGIMGENWLRFFARLLPR